MGLEMVATHDFSDCWSAPDIVFVPGGGSGVFRALDDDALLDAIARLGKDARWITSVCTGSLLLGAAGLLQGYRSACYWYARERLTAFGAIPYLARVVVDRNRASGGGVTAGLDFALSMIGRWHGEEVARQVELVMEYAPEPPFGCGRPELADAPTRAAATGILEREMPLEAIDRAAARRGF
jgi:cyclohexyl-isocyanide hydratase